MVRARVYMWSTANIRSESTFWGECISPPPPSHTQILVCPARHFSPVGIRRLRRLSPSLPSPTQVGWGKEKEIRSKLHSFLFFFSLRRPPLPLPERTLGGANISPKFFGGGEERGERVLARDSPTLPFEKSSSIVGLLSWLFFLDGCSFVQLS